MKKLLSVFCEAVRRAGPIAGTLSVALLAAAAASAQTLVVVQPTNHAVSPRMSELHGSPIPTGPTVIHHPPVPAQGGGNPNRPDGALQTSIGPLINANGGVSFDGMSVYNGGYIPSDNNIAVGPNHVVEVVNAAYAVYSKTGATLLAPVHLGNLWKSLTGSTCSNNSGDTVVQYDRVADRWMITQLGSLSSPYSECIAVSQTNDPVTTAYNLYSYPFGTNLNDYPKFGVWPTTTNSAYLATYNLFASGSSFVGSEICAYDRTAMLAGATTPAALCFTGITGASFLPVDLDGSTPPLDGTPGYFMDLFGSSIGVYKMFPNFSTSTATLSSFSTIPVAGYSSTGSSPQPGTTEVLDSLSDRMMYRLAFRMFSDHESIVTNHSVVGSSSGSGVRWYELRSPVSSSGTFSLYQQGTFSPDASYRWMGSAAMDQGGDIAIGYSLSNSSSIYPSVEYTGRTPSDALGTMETEATIIAGVGSQTGYTRWGDYSAMRIDPSDDCAFWYVNEYYPVTSSYGWYTRIGSFKFTGCGLPPGPDFSLSPSPTSQTVNPGGSTSPYTVTINPLNGFNSPVTFTILSGLPAGASGTFSPNPTYPSTGLTVSTSSSTPAGSYPLTVQGVSGSLTHTTSVTLNVADFTISASPSSRSVAQGSTTTYTVTIGSLGGFSGSVALGVDPLPSGVTGSFAPNPVTGGAGSSTLTLTASISATIGGPVAVTITGTSGALNHSVSPPVTVTVTAQPQLSAPSGLKASAVKLHNGKRRVNLSWTDGANPGTNNDIERCAGSGCTNFGQIAQVAGTSTSYQDSSVSAGTTYNYRVRAQSGSAFSGYSNTATATTP